MINMDVLLALYVDPLDWVGKWCPIASQHLTVLSVLLVHKDVLHTTPNLLYFVPYLSIHRAITTLINTANVLFELTIFHNCLCINHALSMVMNLLS